MSYNLTLFSLSAKNLFTENTQSTGERMAKKQVGILGSAFDPPHYAHAAMAIVALEKGSLDEIWLCPSPNRWDKTPVAPLDSRIPWTAMLAQELCSRNYPVQVSTEEIAFGEYRGSYVFLKHLSSQYEDICFRPLVGLDAWNSLHLWRDPVTGVRNGEILRKEFSFLVFPRGQDTPPCLESPHLLMPSLATLEKELTAILPCPSIGDLSSSLVRSALAESNSMPFVFPEIEKTVRESQYYTSKA